MQQSAESEKQQFSLMTGKSVVTKLKPSLEGLGNNKESQRDWNYFCIVFVYTIKQIL
jgi:hypothetical protein